MTELSPAAQAVLDAYGGQVGGSAAITSYERRGLAAALEALADQVVPDDYDPLTTAFYPEALAYANGMRTRHESIRDEILAIAAELRQSS